eukprot:1999377-Pleurochrysis_carterae.AAC.11
MSHQFSARAYRILAEGRRDMRGGAIVACGVPAVDGLATAPVASCEVAALEDLACVARTTRASSLAHVERRREKRARNCQGQKPLRRPEAMGANGQVSKGTRERVDGGWKRTSTRRE